MFHVKQWAIRMQEQKGRVRDCLKIGGFASNRRTENVTYEETAQCPVTRNLLGCHWEVRRRRAARRDMHLAQQVAISALRMIEIT